MELHKIANPETTQDWALTAAAEIGLIAIPTALGMLKYNKLACASLLAPLAFTAVLINNKNKVEESEPLPDAVNEIPQRSQALDQGEVWPIEVEASCKEKEQITKRGRTQTVSRPKPKTMEELWLAGQTYKSFPNGSAKTLFGLPKDNRPLPKEHLKIWLDLARDLATMYEAGYHPEIDGSYMRAIKHPNQEWIGGWFDIPTSKAAGRPSYSDFLSALYDMPGTADVLNNPENLDELISRLEGYIDSLPSPL